MRPQQQNRRMRGRNGGGNNNQNRKGPNPLTRNYESNGPDVKIRGSAQQIAEKYAQLARDAQSSGDRVMAENYLQHAEHYNRIIAAAQAQMPIQNMQNQRDASDDDLDDERDEFEGVGNVPQQGSASQGNVDQPNPGQGGQGNPGQSNGNGDYSRPQQAEAPAELGSGPQPEIEGMPAEVALNPEAAEGNPGRAANGHTEGRRNRRPRRGERARPAEANTDEEPASDGLAATLSRGASAAKEPAAEDKQGDGGPTLVDADS
ncbi:DUF4167 domain-containing protein [Mesorhizobium sp. YM1C-6-2]|uniref:DUF4167 domain-containing protein n=1 Tax=Mesorhizobium sp. YM1C-6-2 TaxID=1827501 RepID=UPI000EF1F2E3|nr:DUF4167 domain-containing protein [Mesorhizobium sp. YM1C-6-2]